MLNWNGDYFWVGRMAHAMCIGNGWIAVVIFLTSIHIAIGYFRFMKVNREIMKSQDGNKYFKTKDTFKGFINVFLYCGLKSFVFGFTLFVGWYWLLAIIEVLNAYWIEKTVRIFRRQIGLFQIEVIPAEEVYAMTRELRLEKSALEVEVTTLKAEMKLLKKDVP